MHLGLHACKSRHQNQSVPHVCTLLHSPLVARRFAFALLLELMSAVGTPVAPLRLRCKVLLLGETTVGKTSICHTFCSNGTEFPKNYLMTICCDLQVKVVQIPDSTVSVELFIYDCSGQDIFREQLAQVLDGACAVVYVYVCPALKPEHQTLEPHSTRVPCCPRCRSRLHCRRAQINLGGSAFQLTSPLPSPAGTTPRGARHSSSCFSGCGSLTPSN